MANASLVWPKNQLPRGVLIGGYSVSQSFGLIRTPMDSGLARQRRKFSNPPTRTSVQWLMTAGQVSFFKSWLAYRAAFGGAFFQIELVIDDGIQYYDARFVSSGSNDVEYTPIRGGKSWIVKASLEVKTPLQISEEIMDELLLTPIDDLSGMQSLLNTNSHILQPAIDAWRTADV